MGSAAAGLLGTNVASNAAPNSRDRRVMGCSLPAGSELPGHLTHCADFLIASHSRMLRGARHGRLRRVATMRQITLVAFLQAQNCSNFASSWRHPLSRLDTWSPDYYRHLGRVLEEGRFPLGFFDDRLSMPDMYGGDHAP